MQESERKIIRQFTVDLKRDVIPIDMLPYLLCLTEDDCEAIQNKQDRDGARAAVPTLLDKLKRRVGAFNQFLTALEETGCSHLRTLLQNAMRDQTHHPQPEHNSNETTETTSNVGSENLKTPTTETTQPFPGSSLTKAKQSLTVTSKKPNKTPKTKKNRVPKENTTSPPETKTNNKAKTKPLKSHQELSIPTGAKQAKATKGMPTTPPQKSSASQQITKCPSTTPKKPICTSEKPDPTPTFQPSETNFDTLICYARENCEIAKELKKFLENKCGLKVCMDLYNFVPGKPTTDNICDSITSSQSFVFLLSPKFTAKLWAQWELKNALYDFNVSQQSGNSKNIIPVLLEGCQLPEDLKLYTPIEMEGSGSRMGVWKKIAETILGRPFQGDANDVDGGVEDSTDDVDVSNEDGVHDEVDNTINDDDDGGDDDDDDDDDNVLDGYDDGEDNHGDTNDDGAENVGVNANGSNNTVDDSNSGGSYHGENGVNGSDNCGVEDDDDDDDISSDGKEDHDDDNSDNGGNDDAIKDSAHNGSDDDSVDDSNDGGDHDEDGHQDNEGANNGPDDVGNDCVDHIDDSVDNAGDEKCLNHNDSGIGDNGVGGCDGSGGNNDDDANNENETDVAYNNIKSL